MTLMQYLYMYIVQIEYSPFYVKTISKYSQPYVKNKK